MKKILLALCCLIFIETVHAQSVNIKPATTIINTGALHVVMGDGNFVNNGYYTDAAGTLNMLGGITYSGAGTMDVYNLTVNNIGTTLLNSLLSVNNSAVLAAGNFNANNNLYIRSDVNPATANMFVSGVLTDNVQGLLTNATVASGGCPSYNSTLSLNISGPVLRYQWQWSPDNSTWTDVSGATNATYTATVITKVYYRCNLTTSNSAYAQSTPSKQLLSLNTLTGTTSQTDVTCNGGSNGVASVSISGGTGTLTYSWVPSGGTESTATGLPAGTYTCTITDANTCSTTRSFTITQPVAMTAGVSSQTNVSCNGGSNGAATITVSGGTGAKTYSWAPSPGAGQGTVSVTGLTAQVYTCTITDANSCTKQQTVNITSPSAITSSVASQTNVACNGGSTGAATITTSGGAGSNTYSWTPSPGGGQGTVSVIGLTAQVYTCTITDANSCTKQQTVNITSPTAITSSVASQTNVACNGGSTGAATITTSGGAGSNTYSWSPSPGAGQGTVSVTGLTAQVYTCTITDANSCTKAQTVNVTQPTVITSSVASQTNVACNGGNTGAAIITTSGGAGSNTYTWAPGNPAGQGTVSVSGLTAQVYTCTITDANSCIQVQTVNITDPAPIVITGVGSNSPVCAGLALNLSSTAIGGTGTISYNWQGPNSFTSTAANASESPVTVAGAGTYTVSATDDNGCVATASTAAVVIPVLSAGVITGVSSIIVGAATTLSDANSGGIWSASNGNVTVSSAGVVTAVATGTSTISYTVGNSCGTNVATYVVSVNASVLCSGTSVMLFNAVPGGVWSSANIHTATVDATSGVVTGLAPGVVNISYTAAGTTTYTTVTVNTLPDVIAGAGAICAGSTLSLSNTYSSSMWNGSWASVNPSVATISATGIVTGISGGTATMMYTIGNGCSRTATVTINTMPAAITGGTSACVGGTTTLGNTVSGGVWTTANASLAAVSPSSGIVTGVNAGSTIITYVLGPCKSMTVVSITPLPATIMGTLKACPGATAALSCAITGGGTWSSSNNAVATVDLNSGVVTPVATGVANITFTSGPGCYRTAQFTVNPAAAALTGVMSICPGAMTTLTSSSSTVASWTSSNTSVATVNSTAGYVSGIAAGTATITYTLGTGCSINAVVTVLAVPTITGPSAACVGSSVALTSSMPGGTWLSSNTVAATVDIISGMVNAVSSSAGLARITYTAPNGCTKTVAAFSVNPLPNDPTGVRLTCVGGTIQLSSTGGTWSSGNSSIVSVTNINTGYLYGASAGIATVSYIATTGCFRTADVTVTPAPAVITGTNVICAGGTTQLFNATAGGAWVSGNVGAATVGSTTGFVTAVGTSGTATISYTIGNSCRTTTTITINALPAVIGGAATVCRTAVTTLSDATSGGTWSSSNTSIATVGTGLTAGYGAVSGISAGTTTITYKLTATGCQRTTTVTVNACSRPGLSEPASVEFTLYPNPTRGRFTVSVPVSGSLAVYAMDGKQVGMYAVQAGETEISLSSNLAAGMYMCRYNGEDGTNVMLRLVLE